MDIAKSIVLSSRLESYDVTNPEGRDLGQVQNFMLDMAHGRISFVVVSFGGILGLTDKWFALPWELLRWSPENKKFIIDLPQEALRQAPGIDKHKWPHDVDLSWLRQCYLHFGCHPYWEGEREEQIKRLAYNIWEQEGRPEGQAVEEYYRAEKILATPSV